MSLPGKKLDHIVNGDRRRIETVNRLTDGDRGSIAVCPESLIPMLRHLVNEPTIAAANIKVRSRRHVVLLQEGFHHF